MWKRKKEGQRGGTKQREKARRREEKARAEGPTRDCNQAQGAKKVLQAAYLQLSLSLSRSRPRGADPLGPRGNAQRKEGPPTSAEASKGPRPATEGRLAETAEARASVLAV